MSVPTYPSLAAPAWPARLTRGGLWTIGLGGALAALSGPAHRLGVLGAAPALLALMVGSLLVCVGALIAIAALLAATALSAPAPRLAAAAGILAALAFITGLLLRLERGGSTPPIHEVSTDLGAPPPFVALQTLRAAAPGSAPAQYERQITAARGSIDVAALQHSYYADIQPLELSAPPASVLAHCVRVARELGWQIIAVAPADGRLEAVARSGFFGFEDDVVVRVRARDGGARVDVRSKSRFAMNDGGSNAAHVRSFLERLRHG
jgi:hypothetical protein